MVVTSYILVGLISFWPFSTNSKSEEPKIFLKDNTAQYGQCFYGIDKEDKAWKANIKDKQDAAENIILSHARPILSQKKIISIFSDERGKPLFEDAEGLFYYEDGSIISNPLIKLQTAAPLSSNHTVTASPNITLSALDKNKNFLFSEADTSLIPTNWQLKYFGYVGVDPDAPAPNGSGLTILQCYLQGVDPMPEEAITMTVSAAGPFRAPANVTLVASITHPANVKVSHIDFFVGLYV